MTIKQDVGGAAIPDSRITENVVDVDNTDEAPNNDTTDTESNIITQQDAEAVSTASQIARERHPMHNEDGEEENEEFIRQWRESPWAVGYTKPTWEDEKVSIATCCIACNDSSKPHKPYMYCTAIMCCCFKLGRVGNMFVFKQKMVEYQDDNDDVDDEEQGERISSSRRGKKLRPKLQCVIGPYFAMTMTLTIPCLAGISAYTFYQGIWDNNLHWGVILGWALVTFIMFQALLATSCADPGILYRRRTLPSEVDAGPNTDWRWNDQAQSYRPKSARFDSEVQAIVEEFDHTCPWVGTAIGRRNMPSFKRFLWFLAFTIAYDIVLLTMV